MSGFVADDLPAAAAVNGAASAYRGDLETKEAELIFGRDEGPSCSITISVSESLLTQSARTVLEAE